MSRSKETLESVVFGTGLTALTGATTGATIAILKNAPVKQYAISTGLNCGVFGATFFMVRETFITYQRKQNFQFGLKDSETKDIDALFSSAMAGATTGGLLSAAYKGPKSVVSGAVMYGAICTGLQVMYTAGNNWRQQWILEGGVDRPVTNKGPEQPKEVFSIMKYINLPSWFPIHQLSEEEYNDLLDTKLKTLEAELAQLEKEIQSSNKKAD
ncbi:hypothetical protein INT48_004501 [Thamnidium elegans]|uniref:Uncharacterized protein n=1 Tax=Thamnidium elegans TaxID=101142 RepID=A0A8H7T0G9_9FUNG|nr:hypothetical protein INT48_004501 [Thamnidium elegans]